MVCFFAVLFVSSAAWAAGRVQWTETTLKERDGSSKFWRLDLKIFLNRAPDTAHMPVKFEFTPLAYYERSMVDGKEGPQERRVPLTGRQDLIESVDIGFLDPGSGKIEKRTRFTFKVTRAHGFEAGEYRVTIRDGRNGQVIGAPTTLKFEGENEIIDRRTMVFAAPDGKKKKDEKKDEKDEKKDEGGGSDEGTEPAEDPDPPASEMPPAEEPAPPQEVKEKPGGCGCRVESLPQTPAGPSLLVLAGVAVLVLRRRRAA